MLSIGILLLSLASAAFAGVSAHLAPQLPKSHGETKHHQRRGFVKVRDGHFYLGDQPFDFRSFNSPGIVSGTPFEPFEAEDAIRSIAGLAAPVVRSYTLSVTSFYTGSDIAHIQGYDHATGKWQFNEQMFKRLDRNLAVAAKLGVKVILPLINQDYGAENTNWVGNYVDLIKYRYNISDYQEARTKVDWYLDPVMRQAYKDIVSFVLKRRNTVNHRIYGQDDTIFGWQTGNEMNGGGPQRGAAQPPPGVWTADVARFLKKLSPHTLVIDGSFSRTANATTAWAPEALKSPHVDVLSYHFYGSGDIELGRPMASFVRAHKKSFVCGEYGFFSSISDYKRFNSNEFRDIAGMLVWSLRPHSAEGGFLTHSEGNGQWSFHVPGWREPIADGFMAQEDSVVNAIYDGSYRTLGQKPAPKPIPVAPQPLVIRNATHTGFTFRGSAWAKRYELWSANFGDSKFGWVSKTIQDNVQAGTLFVAVSPANATLPIVPHYKPRKGSDHLPTWHDSKWSFARHSKRGHSGLAERAAGISGHNDLGKAGILKRSGPGKTQGAWYALRGVNTDGVAGTFSTPFFIEA